MKSAKAPSLSVNILFAIVVMTTGCSGNGIATYPVEGIVVLEDGTPVQTGTVEFNSLQQDLTARGKIQPDGTFRLTTFKDGDGAVPGIHDAVVVQLISTEDLPLHEHDHGPTIAPKYSHYDSAGLRFTVHDDRTNSLKVVLRKVTADSATIEPLEI
jgi:hypothetical protein